MFCKNCGNEVSADALFCKNCGATIKKKSEPVVEEPVLAVETVVELTNTPVPSKKSSKKWIAIGCGAIAVALIVVGALWIGLGVDDSDDKIIGSDESNSSDTSDDEMDKDSDTGANDSELDEFPDTSNSNEDEDTADADNSDEHNESPSEDVPDDSQENTTSLDWNAIYSDKIGEYKYALTMGLEQFNETYDFGEDCDSINALMVWYSYTYGGSVEYTIVDVDGNGISELVLADTRNIIDIYTWDGKSIVKLFENCHFGDRSRLHVLTDGRLLSEGSSGASSASCKIYSVDAVTGKLSLLEAYYCDGNGPDSYMTGYTYLTESEYYDLLDSWLKESAFDTFEWISIGGNNKQVPEEDPDKPSESVNLVSALSEDERYGYNLFLSNFSEQGFGNYPATDTQKETIQLIRFAFTYNNINAYDRIVVMHDDTNYYYAIETGYVDSTLQYFFGKTLQHPAENQIIADGIIYYDGYYLFPASDGEYYGYLSIINGLYLNEDNTYSVSFSVYAISVDAYYSGESLYAYYAMNAEQASQCTELSYCYSGEAVFDVQSSYHLLSYTRNDK